MKKLVLSFLLCIMAIGANAQVTMNVRAGGGINTSNLGLTGLFQVNIPFKKASPFTFSPTIQYNTDFDTGNGSGSQNLLLPLNIGYKKMIGDNCIFFPKIGPAVGLDLYSDDGFNAGPAVELAFEIKHFVVALNGYYAIEDCSREYYYNYGYGHGSSGRSFNHVNVWNVSLTAGYKF